MEGLDEGTWKRNGMGKPRSWDVRIGMKWLLRGHQRPGIDGDRENRRNSHEKGLVYTPRRLRIPSQNPTQGLKARSGLKGGFMRLKVIS